MAFEQVILPEPRLSKESIYYKQYQQILNLEIDDSEFLETLQDLSSVYEPNQVQSVEDIKRISFDLIESYHQNNLTSLSKIIEDLKEIENDSKLIGGSIQELENQLLQSQSSTSQLIGQVKGLSLQKLSNIRTARDKIQLRKLIIDTFLSRFTLDEKEVSLIQSSKVDSDYFAVLKKVQRICDDCKALLVIDGQNIGTEILETMSNYQELAFEKLNRWLQVESRSFAKETPLLSDTLKEAIKSLKSRPVLLQSCLDEIGSARQEALAKFFLNALTRGNPSENIPAIEENIHEPVRYVSEILSWIHQTMESEKLLLYNLFDYTGHQRKNSLHSGIPNAHSRRVSSTMGRNRRSSLMLSAYESLNSKRRSANFSEFQADLDNTKEITVNLDFFSGPRVETLMSDLMNNFAEGLLRPMKTRIEQMAMSQVKPSVIQKMMDIIHSYEVLIRRCVVMQEGYINCLLVTFTDIIQLLDRIFFELLNDQASNLLRDGSMPNVMSLEPLESCRFVIDEMYELFLNLESSAEKDKEVKADKILQVTMDPILQKLAISSHILSKPQESVYSINSLNEILESLQELTLVQKTLAGLKEQILVHENILIQEQCGMLFSMSGLLKLIKAMESKPEDIPLSHLQDVEQNDIVSAMTQFDKFLTTTSIEAAEYPLCKLLTSKERRDQVRKDGFRLFVLGYKRIYEAVLDPKNKYEFPSTLMKRNIAQVETLLNIH